MPPPLPVVRKEENTKGKLNLACKCPSPADLSINENLFWLYILPPEILDFIIWLVFVGDITRVLIG